MWEAAAYLDTGYLLREDGEADRCPTEEERRLIADFVAPSVR